MIIRIFCYVLFLTSFLIPQQNNWMLLSSTAGNAVTAIDIYKQNPDTLYATSFNYTLRSIDNGKTWDSISYQTALFGAIKVDPSNSKKVYMSCDGFSLESNDLWYTSNIDSMNLWKLLPIGHRITEYVIEIDPINSEYVYADVGPGLFWRTTNSGKSWTGTFLYDYMTTLAISASNDSILYGGWYWDGVFRSSDFGENWHQIPINISGYYKKHIVMDPMDENIIYLAFDKSGIYKTTDGGINWSKSDSGMANSEIECFYINPQNRNEIYAGGCADSLGCMLYRTTNGGKYWEQYGNGLPTLGKLTSVCIDNVHKKLFAGVWADGPLSGLYVRNILPDEVEGRKNTDKHFTLNQNYPNPFNPVTFISFTIPARCNVTLKIYDLLGKEIRTLVEEDKFPGKYNVRFDGTNYPSGIYIYRLSAGEYIITKKMLLIR